MIGKFITVEGIDGAGKSTHIERIAAILEGYGVRVVVTREPGGTTLGERLREIMLDKSVEIDPVTETMLMFAARHEHCVEVIRPALKRGYWVLCDRFTDSTYAYQGGGKGVDVSVISQLERLGLWQSSQLLDPDLTLYFDLPVRVALDRLGKSGREKDRFEQQDWGFFYRVRSAFIDRSKMFPHRIKVIDADDLVSNVQARVEHVVHGFAHSCIKSGKERQHETIS